MSEQYWSPRDFHFTSEQILWILPHLKELKVGLYPPEPSSGYTENPINKKQPTSHAPYETACQIAAEIEVRLKRTGLAGELLYAQVCAEFLELSYEAKQALYYISGWKRKRISFVDWKRKRRSRLVTQCSKCKEKTETHKVRDFRLCKKCWQKLPDPMKAQYPVW